LLHQLTKDCQYKLRFDLQALDSGQWYWAEYSTFIVDSEATKYRLTASGYSGNAGDAIGRFNNRKFTTFDNDNDISLYNCASYDAGGFWSVQCFVPHVNTAAGYGRGSKGPSWYKLPGPNTKVQKTRGWLMCH